MTRRSARASHSPPATSSCAWWCWFSGPRRSGYHGDSIPCYASRVLLLPLFKPLTVPMWGVLLTMLNYVYWEQARKYQPREVALGGKLRAGERPVERNWLLRCIVRGAAVLLGAWSSAALFAAPTLVGFLPVALMLLVGVPVALIMPSAPSRACGAYSNRAGC